MVVAVNKYSLLFCKIKRFSKILEIFIKPLRISEELMHLHRVKCTASYHDTSKTIRNPYMCSEGNRKVKDDKKEKIIISGNKTPWNKQTKNTEKERI